MIAKDYKSAFTQRWIIFLNIDVTEAKIISKMRGGISRFSSIQSASYISMSLRSGSWDRCSVSACNRFWKLYISADAVISGSVMKETRRKLWRHFLSEGSNTVYCRRLCRLADDQRVRWSTVSWIGNTDIDKELRQSYIWSRGLSPTYQYHSYKIR